MADHDRAASLSGRQLDALGPIGADGTLYALVGRSALTVRAYGLDGKERWRFPIGSPHPQASFMLAGAALREDGALIVPVMLADDRPSGTVRQIWLYAIATSSAGLADAPWPRVHRDNQGSSTRLPSLH